MMNLLKKANNIKTTDTSDLDKKIWLWYKNWWNWKECYWYDCSSKYITTQEFHRLTADNFAATLKQANLGSKTDKKFDK